MTAETRSDRDLPAILEDLYLGPSPDYRDEVMTAAIRTRQRPAWTFAGRWFPMADITSQPAIAPRVPWRAVGVALLIIALVVGAAIVAVGARQTKVPPPFGVARNGQIAYSANGDIYTVDPVTGISTAIVTGSETDTDPVFSPDGTHVAFIRATDDSAGHPVAIVVAGADGSKPLVITADPLPDVGRYEWGPDSKTLLVNAPDESAIWSFDTTTTGAPHTVAKDAVFYVRPFQPPNGSSILAYRTTDQGVRIVLLDLATSHETVLDDRQDTDPGSARWSPDGSQVVYNAAPTDDQASQRLFIVNADGTGRRQITHAPGAWVDIDATWSPDGKSIAFTRYQQTPDGSWDIRPIGIYALATGKVVEVGPLPRDVRAQRPSPGDSFASRGEGFSIDWSPDGKSLIAFPGEASGHAVVINPVDGTWQVLDPLSQPSMPMQAWQRKAP